jgi:hypothetical protein
MLLGVALDIIEIFSSEVPEGIHGRERYPLRQALIETSDMVKLSLFVFYDTCSALSTCFMESLSCSMVDSPVLE